MTSSSEYEAKAEELAESAQKHIYIASPNAQTLAQLSTTYATLALVAIQRNRS